MSVGYTPETFGLLIVLAFLAVLLLGGAWRVYRRVFLGVGGRSEGLALASFALFLGGLLLALSLALDALGTRTVAVVTSKRETVQVTARGGWRRTYQIGLKASSEPVAQGANLASSPALYDEVIDGDHLDVRLLRAGPFSLVRDARENTWTVVPWDWVVGAACGLAFVVLGWRYLSSLIVVVVVVAGVTLPMWVAYQDWRGAEFIAPMTERAVGTVREVTRVTEWRFRTSGNSSSRGRIFTEFSLPQHYDVVALDLTPVGQRGSVLGLDAVDVEKGAPPVLRPGARVEVRYAKADPRDVRLGGHTRRWHWRDMLAVYDQIGLVLALVGGLIVAGSWFLRPRRRRTDPVATP